MKQVWSPRLIVNTQDIIYNIKTIKNYIGDNVDIMPIIKDDAYGTEINNRIDIFEKANIKILGVAIVDEGIKLREAGYKGDIFVLNQPLKNEIPAIYEYNLIAGIGSIDFLNDIGDFGKNIKIHIEIGTGMGRTGIRPTKINEYIKTAQKYKNIIIDGIYTHFSCSDCDKEYTKKQIESFNFALDIAKKEVPTLRYIHCCNSAGIIDFPEAHFNLVRPRFNFIWLLPSRLFKRENNFKT